MKSRLVIIVVSLLALLTAGCSSGPSPETAADDLRSLLPGKSALAGLGLQDSAKLYPRNTVWDHLSSIAEIYLNNSLDRLATGNYGSGENRMQIDLMQFRTPLDAFTMHSYHRTAAARPVSAGQRAYILADTLNFLKGAFTGKVVRQGSISDGQLMAAAQMICDKITDTTGLPAELALFPPDNLIPQSEAHWIRDQQQREEPFDFYSAQYALAGDTVTLHFRLNSMVGLPTATEAFIGERGKADEMILAGGTQGLFGSHPDFGLVYCAVEGGTLVAVTGYSDRKTAQAIAESLFARLKEN